MQNATKNVAGRMKSGHTNAVVVGAGIAGVTTALELRRRGARVRLIDRWEPEEILETDSLETVLTADGSDEEYLPVKFRSKITELGVFELWCVHEQSGKEWKLEFSVRDDAE